MDEIAALDAESAEVLAEHQGAAMKKGWQTEERLAELCEIVAGQLTRWQAADTLAGARCRSVQVNERPRRKV